MRGAVIWDWNGTLLDDVEVCIAAMNRLLARRSLGDLTLDRYREVFTFPVQTYYERMGFDFSRESFADVAVEYHDEYEELVLGAELHADAMTVLERLHQAGREQAVLSALEETRLRRELSVRGISGYFSHVYGLSDLHAISKATRGRELLEQMSVNGDAWMIGDTVHDAEVAATMGARCVLVTCGHHAAEQLRSTGAPVFSNLAEAVSFVETQLDQEG
jgi:phosphoglycolate phosphatase